MAGGVSRTYGLIFYDKGKWTIPEVEPHVAIRLKGLFPKISLSSRAPFSFKDTLDFCEDMTWFMWRYPLEISDKDRRRMAKQRRLFEKNIAELEAILLPDTSFPSSEKEFPGLKEGKAPRDYQIKTVKVLERVKTLICADDLGLGKTFTGMTATLMPHMRPAAVVVETHLPDQWMEKYKEFTDLRVHFVKNGKPYPLPSADVYIFKYSTLANWVDVFSTGFFKTAIYDEVQNLRTGTSSNKGSAAASLSADAEYNMGMSHTPMFNYANEIWNIYNILSPGVLGTRDEFAREWGDYWGSSSDKIIVKDPRALGAYLRENYLMIKNTREMVGRELLPVERVVHEIDHDETLVKDYVALAKKLSKTVLYSSDFQQSGAASRELEQVTRQMTGISKARSVANFVKILLESGEAVILAGWHREVYRIWLEELDEYNPMMFTGSESPKQKEINKQAFLAGESNLLIMSLRSGAGTDGLQERGRCIVFGEADWAAGVYEQLEGRLHRDGQDGNVMSFYLFSTFGSDPVMRETLGLKASQARGITMPDSGPIKRARSRDSIKQIAGQILGEIDTEKVATPKDRKTTATTTEQPTLF